MLQALLGPIAGLAKTWMNNRHEQSQAKHQAKMQVISNTATWEEKMAEASLLIAGKTSFGRLYWRFHSFVWVTALLLMTPLFFSAFLTVFLLWIIFQIGISIYYFLRYLRAFGIRGADKLMKLRAK